MNRTGEKKIIKPPNTYAWRRSSGDRKANPDDSKSQMRATLEIGLNMESAVLQKAKDFLHNWEQYVWEFDFHELVGVPITELRPILTRALDNYWQKNIKGTDKESSKDDEITYKIFVEAVIKIIVKTFLRWVGSDIPSGSVPWLESDLPTIPADRRAN